MSTLCSLFGHKLPTGYRGDKPYLSARFKALDGMGTHHADLIGVCGRCQAPVTFAYVHLPEPKNPRWFDRRSADEEFEAEKRATGVYERAGNL